MGRRHAARRAGERLGLLAKHDVPSKFLELAGWGLELIPGDGASRLGGRPELRGAWPRNAAGHALTHLASVALAELPAFEGRELLPAGGTPVFFGDFHQDSEGDEWLVLHLDGDKRAVPPQVSLDEYADGGQITFHGAADDVRAGRWDRIHALFESS